jgi:cofilin
VSSLYVTWSFLLAIEHRPLTLSSRLQDETCLKAYEELKLGKKHKFIVYGMGEGMKTITTLKQVKLDEPGAADFETFIKELPEKECRWGVYDLEFDQGEGKRNKLCFVMW